MEFSEQVKSQVDIVHVIGEYVRLRKAAAARFTGLCPFHTEKTPSFSVNAAQQYFYCFGCHAKGDVYSFLMQIEGVTFYEALKSLAERYGIPMPARREQVDPDSRLREAIYRMHEIAAMHFQANLNGPAGADARAYIARRGLAPATMQQFTLGYSERSGNPLLKLLQREGFGATELEASGLVFKRDDGTLYDRFRNRLMFPIHNESGKVIAFGGRALSDADEPKYLNSSKTPIYDKSAVLYNLHRAKQGFRQHERAVLVEGYMDVIGVYAAGIVEVVATCGTALTSQQVRAIKRHSDHIVVNFDPDTAGANATERSIQTLLDEGMHVRILELNGNLDPDEYIKHNGADVYRDLLDRAQGYFLWLADRARKKFDMRTAEGRTEGFKWLLPAIRRITDRIERAAVADEVAEYLGVERGLILDEFRKAATGQRGAKPASRLAAVPKAERVLIRSLVNDPEVRSLISERLGRLSVVRSFQTVRIVEVISKLHVTNPAFTFAELEGRLEDRDKTLLAETVFADNSGEEIFTSEQALSYLNVLERGERQAQIAGLRTRLKEAERSGNLQLAMELMDEISRAQRAL